MAEFLPIEPEDGVLELAQELISKYHPWLENWRIGFLFRSERMTQRGDRFVFGQASKVSAKTNALLPAEEKLDFLIWIAQDWWWDATDKERAALLDHELCHCGQDGKMKDHDVQEFVCIIERHGLWYPDLARMGKAAQQYTLPGLNESLRKAGAVLDVVPAAANGLE